MYTYNIYPFAYLSNHYSFCPISYCQFDLRWMCSIRSLCRIPQISPSTFALAHCFNKPTGKHPEITDNSKVGKPSPLIINSRVRFISYLRSVGTCKI